MFRASRGCEVITTVRKLSDKNLVDFIKKIFEILPDAIARGTYAGGVGFEFSKMSELEGLPKRNSERLIDQVTISRLDEKSDVVRFERGVTSSVQPNNQQIPFNKFSVRDADPYYDELAIFRNPNSNNILGYVPFTPKERIAISREIGKFAVPINLSNPTNAEALGHLLDQNLSDLQRITVEFLERSANSRLEDEAAYRARKAELDARFSKKSADLDRKKAELEKRRSELNDREPQHERRRLREHLTERLQTTISSPLAETGQRERISHYYYFAAAMVFVTFSISLTLLQSASDNAGSAAFWALSFKSLISGVAGAAFAWAGLSGLKATAIATREYEQSIQRYAFDMDRASWVVETILQMNSTETAKVPDEWLENVCRDLFVTGDRSTNDTRSLDAFAALFDATAKARIGTNGLEFEIDRKGARKLAHDI